MAPARYLLHTRWSLAAPVDRVWDVLADPRMSWPAWWPQCTADTEAAGPDPEPPAGEALLGRTARVAFRAGPGYTLHLAIRPTIVRAPHFIEFDAGGDLSGVGRVALVAADGDRTAVHIHWAVRPTRRWMGLLSPLARPVFTAAHGAVMRRGERGLRAFLASGNG